MHLTLLIATVVAFVLTGCQSQRVVEATNGRSNGIYDFTTKRSATCELHGVAMVPKVVELSFGMKAFTGTMQARQELFPHADERYETGYCIPLAERRGQVYVCARCTDARASWMSAQKKLQR